jgi:hypothetical protein
MNKDHCESSILISNDGGQLSYIALEPWGEEVSLQPGDHIGIMVSGPKDAGTLKLEYAANALFLYAWPGSTLRLTLNDELLDTASGAIAAI